ncbi:MAG TPA: HDOD domain-containing protein [Polyangiaceae bacterium]|nr:HDOD domain-containing protein [Polyangiaceae bacterium]
MVASPSHGSFGKAEDNWFGSDDSEAQSRAEQSVAAVGARIVGAKPFPIAARRLEELTRNPKARLEQVVSVLETDPGLSVRLLRLVNSAGYGLKVRVTSVRHAAVLVGTRRLHQVATTAAILDLFDAGNETAVELLEHAAVVGSLCRYLAVHLGLPHDELFTCGFLHDIGKLMLLDTEGEKYAALVREYGNAPDQMHIQERKMFGFDHAVLGAHVLTAWNIPEPVPKVVAFHHQPGRAMQDTLLASMVQTLRLADMMSYAVIMDSEEEGIALVTQSEAAQYLEISEPQVAAMWSDLRALADRSRARSHGQPDLEVVAPRRLDVPRSLRPRRSGAPRSLRPGDMPSISTPAAGSTGHDKSSNSAAGPASPRTSDVNAVPAHFACVACSKPSFGNLCAACEGHVCPEHQVGLEHWCVLCVREHEKFRERNQVPNYLKVTGLALAGFSVGASVTSVMVSQTFAVWKLIVAPLTMVLLWGVLLPVAHRLWLRRRFISTRPKGRMPLPIKLPRPNPVFISSLDANLEKDGLMGPSMPPPSQSGISVIGPVGQAVVVPFEAELPLPPSLVKSVPAQPLEASRAPTTDRSPAESTATETAAPPSEDDLEHAAAALERSSEVMPRAEPVPAPIEAALEPAGPLVGAAASLNPPPVPEVATSKSAAADSIAAHIATLLGQPTTGLSEFPSVGSASELEQVVASVSALLGRDLPNNDYMGPSADLRAATIAPIPEPDSEPPAALPMPAPVPAVEAAAEPAPVLEAAPAIEVAAPVEEAVAAALPAETPPIAEAPPIAPIAEAEPLAKPESLAEAAPLAEPEPLADAAPIADAAPDSEPAPKSDVAPIAAPIDTMPPASVAFAPVAARLMFKRVNLDQGCSPRVVFKCAIPIAESCSPAPRRTSLRPSAQEFATSEGPGPSTLRGLG